MSKSATSSAAALPEGIQVCLDSFQSSLDQVEAALGPFSTKNLADMTAEMPPAEKAKLQLLLAYSCNALFYMYLKTQGANVQQHPVSSELNRVKEYFTKLKNATEKPSAASDVAAARPSLRLDKEASNRVVKHSLPRQESKGADKKKRGSDDSDSDSSSSSSSSSKGGLESDGDDMHSKKSKKGKDKSSRDKKSGGSSQKGKGKKDKGVSKKDKKEKKKTPKKGGKK
jgi:exosome complex protein LRP1